MTMKVRNTFAKLGYKLNERKAEFKFKMQQRRSAKKRVKALFVILPLTILFLAAGWVIYINLRKEPETVKLVEVKTLPVDGKNNEIVSDISRKILKNFSRKGKEGIKERWLKGLSPMIMKKSIRTLEETPNIDTFTVSEVLNLNDNKQVYLVECENYDKKITLRFCVRDKKLYLISVQPGSFNRH